MQSLLQAILAAAIAAGITVASFYASQTSAEPFTFDVILFGMVMIGLLAFKNVAQMIPEQISLPSANSEVGQVKWFNVSKGFGFITRQNGEDIFVHYRCVRANGRGRRVLEDGQTVRFDVGMGEKGPQAENVRPV